MAEIPLTKGFVAIVDDDDYDRVSQVSWHAKVGRKNSSVYATNKNLNKSVLMASFVLNAKGMVDHINGNTLDNRKSNLRICNYSQNGANSKKKSQRKPYKGVFLDSRKKFKRYFASITIDRKQLFCGLHYDQEDAAYTYDFYAMMLFGDFARTNFNYKRE